MSHGERTASALRWVREKYTAGALILLNSAVAVVLINLALAGVFFVRDILHPWSEPGSASVRTEPPGLFEPDGSPTPGAKRSAYQLEWVDFSAYEGVSETYVGDVLDDFFKLGELGFAPQPWVHFSEPLVTGKRVNVVPDRLGFPVRHTVNPSNDNGHPVTSVFVLGGSTSFGYHVSDEHTFPSYLSRVLNERARVAELSVHIEVTNYGRAFYYPSQELVLLIDLLRLGHRPHLVIFMDGVNLGTTQDVPPLYAEYARRFKGMQREEAQRTARTFVSTVETLDWIPMVRLVRAIQRRMPKALDQPDADPAVDPLEVEHAINVLKQNQRMTRVVCQSYEIECLFFLQPNPTLNYATSLYRRALPESFLREAGVVKFIYKAMQAEGGRIYLGDLFRLWGEGRKAIVDDVHYSPGFNGFLAEHTAKHVNLKNLVPGASGIGASEATGGARTPD